MPKIQRKRKLKWQFLAAKFLIGLVFSLIAHAETSLWRVSKGNHSLLIGGTVHLLRESDYPLPDEFEQAFRESRLLVLETDMDALLKPETQADLARRLMYNDGSRLKDHIKPATFKSLTKYCRSAKLPVAPLQAMRPALVMLTLALTQMKSSGQTGLGVDQFYLQKAKAIKKPVAGLESLQKQMETLANMGAGQEDELLLSTLKDLKKTNVYVDKITLAWRKGNLAELEKWGIEPMLSEFPKFNQNLLSSRNKAWMEKIENYLLTPEKELILVGALHLAGKDGVLTLLQKKGYNIEQY